MRSNGKRSGPICPSLKRDPRGGNLGWKTGTALRAFYGRCGNLKPSFTFFYDWSGPWLIQPGVDWTFWDPFRASVRYNYLDGRGNRGLGISNNKDTVWVELQYLLY